MKFTSSIKSICLKVFRFRNIGLYNLGLDLLTILWDIEDNFLQNMDNLKVHSTYIEIYVFEISLSLSYYLCTILLKVYINGGIDKIGEWSKSDVNTIFLPTLTDLIRLVETPQSKKL